MTHRVYIPAVDAPETLGSSAYWFVFQGDSLLVHQCADKMEIPEAMRPEHLGLQPLRTVYLGTLDEKPCFAAEIARSVAVPEQLTGGTLRSLWGGVPDDLFVLAGRAVQLLTWDRTHQFCGQCGTPTRPVPGERAKGCPACDLRNYPRISPAVIVLVSRGNAMLLTRGLHFPPGFFGVLAGFVEAGESLEDAVVREIREEASIEVRNIKYFGSQPWPFPHQLMVGFTAEWSAGEIQVDPLELAEAGWYTRETLPNIPPPFSIARRLIDAFLAEHPEG